MSTPTETAPATGLQTRSRRRATKVAADKGKKPNLIITTVMVLLCIAWVLPTFGLFVTSLRPEEDINSSGWWTAFANPLSATTWTLENYQGVWSGGQTPINISFVNSLAVAIPATVLPIMVAAFAAYAFTFMEFPGRDWIFIAFVALLVVPNQVALVPLLQFYGQIGLTGTFPAVWLAHSGFGMPLAVYILRNYMATLPRAVIESAKIDGASHFVTFWRLIVPMSVPALVSFAIFQFLWVWNDLLVALVFLGSGENMVLTVNIKGLVGQQGQGANLLTAGAFISMVIPLLVFVSLQRYFVRGMTSGAVKG
ncbi:MAG TPA: carbohydrate ABC transporter permease [Pedococcus sp.]|jgi:alpha-glucoside transport system permease protein|uniref:carbohydrate ABC transporter permease n=1 Tax=Pedococcus sp. TaxID=2860345 RepID=UPI002F959A29